MEENNTEAKQKNRIEIEQKLLKKADLLQKSENHVVKLKTNTQDKI